MSNFVEIEFLGVETAKSGDAITVRYKLDGHVFVHVVDGGYVDTGDQLVAHLKKNYGGTRVDHVVLTHSDRDHANGLRAVLEECEVGCLWMNRPWLYAADLIDRFETYQSVPALARKLREIYSGPAALEEIATRRRIPIFETFQGQQIGAFTVMAPTKARYMDLVVQSEKTPEAVEEAEFGLGLGKLFADLFKEAVNFIKGAWGDEYFPAGGTSAENEMSVVQYAELNGHRILLTGDAGRDALHEAADYAPYVGLQLPGIWAFQVPHHGGRHNVDTAVLDRWLGQRMPNMPAATTWNALCSSAKADEAHPRKSVVRAMLHRGAHFAATEGRNIRLASGIEREGMIPIPQAAYPDEQES